MARWSYRTRSSTGLMESSVNRLFVNICSEDLTKSQQFYTSLFGLKVNYDSDWFVHLVDEAGRGLELGLIAKEHDVVPERARGRPDGTVGLGLRGSAVGARSRR
jgi:catechol 2,3-dioxygenase-like lactoylglutathione lyase family enzyme